MARFIRRHRHNPRTGLSFSPSAEWLTTQACAIGLLVIVAGLITGVIGAFAYALVKGLKLQ